MKHETKRVRKPPIKYRFSEGSTKIDVEMPQCKRGGQVVPTSVAVECPAAPQIRASKTWFRMIRDPWLPFQSLTPSHRSGGCMDIARSRRDTPGRLLGRLLDAHPIATFLTFFEVMSTHLSSEFTQKSTFVMAADQQARQRLRVPRTPLHSTIHRLCEILDMRFQSRRCGYCCTIANANFLRKHYAIVASSGTQLYIYPLVYPGSLVFQLSSILYRLSYLKRPHRLSKQSFVLTWPTAFLQLPYQLLAKQYNISS